MKYDVVSFDLQGTLSDSRFSDDFWIKILPELFSIKNNISLDQAKEKLKKYFKKIGQYDYRYYSTDYWISELSPGSSFKKISRKIKHPPYFYKDSLALIKSLKKANKKLIIISSTTYDFINLELGEYKKYFDAVFSSWDDFHVAGKPVILYKKIAQALNVKPNKILHIGDSKTMDIDNAEKAGCGVFYFDKKQPRKVLLSRLKNIL